MLFRKLRDGYQKPRAFMYLPFPISNIGSAPDCIQKLSKLHGVIRNIHVSESVRDVLWVTFSSIIRKVSNADNRSLKTYVSHTFIKDPPETYQVFFQALKKNRDRLSLLQEQSVGLLEPRVLYTPLIQFDLQRSRLKDNNLPTEFDLIVTSPPYIKSMDYTYHQMLELFWVGSLIGLNDRQAINAHKSNYVGTQRIERDQVLANLGDLSNSSTLRHTLSELLSLKQDHATITQRYFTDLYKHLKQAAKSLCTNGEYVMVVGNSNVSGIEIQTNKIVQDLAEMTGLKLRTMFGYVIRKHHMIFPRNGGGFIKIDWVMSFQKL